jgi:hypothetical protein
MAKKTIKSKNAGINEITLHYLKTPDYRSFHVDGVFGGPTPKGNIYIEFFIERAVTPQKVVHEVTEKGLLGKELSREGKIGIIREIEAGAIMDLATAEVLRDWLDSKIRSLKEQLKEGNR